MKYRKTKMKASVAVFACLLILCSCQKIRLTGDMITWEIPIKPYDEIRAENNIQIFMTDSVSSIVVRMDAALESYLVAQFVGDDFRVYYSDNVRVPGGITKVYMPLNGYVKDVDLSDEAELHSPIAFRVGEFDLELSGSSRFFGDLVVEREIDFSLSGTSRYRGNIHTKGKAEVSMSGDAVAEMDGMVQDMHLDLSGAAQLKCSNTDGVNGLVVEGRCSGNLSGNSRAHIHSDGIIEVQTSGSSLLYYTGEPKIFGDPSEITGVVHE